MTNHVDPWKPISPPDKAVNISVRRVNPDLPWGIFWAVDADRNCLLILQHDPANKPKIRLPKLQGLEVEIREPDAGKAVTLVIRLKENEHRELFHRLCLDITSATQKADNEAEAVELFLARTWRWHRLLKDGRDSRLSEEEQKGLIGELSVLKHVLFPILGVKDSIKAWMGPLDAPKDFEIGRVCIEAKARRGAATPFITISSEYQLDTEGVDTLFLHVSEITPATDDDTKAVTITEVARGVLSQIEAEDPSCVELFEQRLMAIGFDWADDYSDLRWLPGPEHVFEIDEDFPRVAPSMYPTGVNNIRYSVSLPQCEPFRSDVERLRNRILGASYVN